MPIRTTHDGFVWKISSDPIQALLYDFDVDGDRLKPAHKYFLGNFVEEIDREAGKKKWNIRVEGRASRSGDEKHNYWLSHRRAENAFRRICDHVSTDSLALCEWVGETRAVLDGQKDGAENMFYRSVFIAASLENRSLRSLPLPHLKPAPPPSPMKAYKLRVVSAATVNYTFPLPGPIQKILQGGISKTDMFMEVFDEEEKVSYLYRFNGSGPSIGPSLSYKGFGLSKTFEGHHWNHFMAPRWLPPDSFEGLGTLSSAGYSAGVSGGGWTRFSIEMQGQHWYSSTRVEFKHFDMGRTIGSPGIGVTEDVGRFEFIKRLSNSKAASR